MSKVNAADVDEHLGGAIAVDHPLEPAGRLDGVELHPTLDLDHAGRERGWPRPARAGSWLISLQASAAGPALLRGRLAPFHGSGPRLLPFHEFRRPDLVARKVAFVQSEQLTLGDFPESAAFGRRDILFRPCSEARGGRVPAHVPEHDIADGFADAGAVPQPERIGFAQ